MPFSLDVLVPKRVSWPNIVTETQKVFLTMSSLPSSPVLRVPTSGAWKDQPTEFAHKLNLNVEAGKSASINFFLEGVGAVNITMFTVPSDNFKGYDVIAGVEPFGWERIEGGLVLAAACAIAIARQTQTTIENGQLMWGSKLDYEPEELLELLRCKEEHSTLADAISELLSNIEHAKQQK